MSFAVRTSSDPMNSATAVTGAIHQAAPDLPVVEVMSMNEIIAQSVSPQRFNMLLLACFAGLALVLAAIGIYSVLSYTVRRRVREIGIRMALGASNQDVVRMILIDGLKPILFGVVLGLGTALALSRVVSSLIYGVRATDPLTFAAIAVLLFIVGIFATIIPAYRATHIEPVRILREE